MERGCDIPPYVYWMGSLKLPDFVHFDLAEIGTFFTNSRGPRGSETQYRRYWTPRGIGVLAAPPRNNSRGCREIPRIASFAEYSEGVSE